MSNQMIDVVLKEVKEIYNRNYVNVNAIDSKLVQLFVFVTALFLLFIQFIEFPKNCLLVMVYVTISILFFVQLFLILYAYRPLSYLSIEPNELVENYCNKKYKNQKELKEKIAGTVAANVQSIKDNVNTKSRIMNICVCLLIVTLIIIMILKNIQ